MAEKITVAELDINTDSFIAEATNTKKVLDSLKAAQKELKNSTEDTTEQQVKNEVAIKRLSAQYTQQKNVLTSLNTQNTDFVKTEQAINTAVNKNVTSISAARANNKELLKVRNELNLSTESGRKALININAKLDDNNKFIKENVSGYEQQKINIGNYEGALRSVFPQMSGVLDNLKEMKAALVAQKAAMSGATTATSLSSKALNIFKIALISTGIGAIVVALGTLIAAFSSTQKGADSITKALAPIKGAFQGIIGVIQDISLNVFSQLGDRFTIVKNNILNGIDTMRLAWNKLSGDTEEAKEIQEEMAIRVKEIEDAQNSLNNKTNALGGIWENAGKHIKESAEAQKQIADLQIQIERAEIRLTVQRAESARIIKEQNKIAEDTSNTLAEREQAAKNAIAESNKILGIEQSIVSMKIQQTKISQSQNDTDRADSLELAQLQAERINKETQSLELQTTLTNKLNTIKNQQAAKDKADAEVESDTTSEKEEAEIQRLTDFENRKRELQNQIDLENAANEEEKSVLKIEQDLEKHLAELADIELKENEKNELKKMLEQQAADEITQIRVDAAEKQIAVNSRITESDKNNAKIREAVAKQLTNVLGGLLGDSLAAKLASIAIETAVQAGLVKIEGAAAAGRIGSAVAAANAQAILASPLTAGLPFVAINTAQGAALTAANAASTTAAVSRILAGAAVQGIGSVANSFYSGGKVPTSTGGKISGQNIPTQKGGDNILATVKSGEVILNEQQQARAGGSSFFKSIGVPGFANGGIASNTTSTISNNVNNNVNEFAQILADTVNNIKVVAIVDEITGEQAIKAEIIDGARI